MKSNPDESLVTFLKQNQPLPPTAPATAEESLFALIDADATSIDPAKPQRKTSKKVLWLIPTAIAAGLTFTWGRYQFDVLSPQLAEQKPEPPVLTVSNTDIADVADIAFEADLELYLESAWGDALTGSDVSMEDFGYGELMAAP